MAEHRFANATPNATAARGACGPSGTLGWLLGPLADLRAEDAGPWPCHPNAPTSVATWALGKGARC